MELKKINFDPKKMKLTNIYRNPKLDDYQKVGINSQKVEDVYGTELSFPETPKDRPYIYGSFVTTIDGKLAYPDFPGAFEVAGRNHFAGNGSLTDFWWLNVLRSSCDALILGAKSISLEEIDEKAVKEAMDQINQKTIVILTGENSTPDIKTFLKILKLSNIEKLLIESPTYSHLLIKEGVYDEAFLNMSCVYMGGKAVSFGSFDEPFKAVNHPHTEVMSVAMHSAHMLFFRHKFIYGIET